MSNVKALNWLTLPLTELQFADISSRSKLIHFVVHRQNRFITVHQLQLDGLHLLVQQSLAGRLGPIQPDFDAVDHV